MANLFDSNARSDEALMGGAKAEAAINTVPRAGLGMPRSRMAAQDPMANPDAYRQSLQNAAAQVRPAPQAPTRSAEPILGYDPESDMLFSGGQQFSGSNLSEIDAAMKAGYLDIDNTGKVPQGMVKVKASQIKNFLQTEGASRGFGSAASEVGSQVLQGLADIPQMGVRAAQFAAPAGSWLESSLKEAGDTFDAERAPYNPDVYGRGEVASALIKGGRSIAPSVAAGAAMMAAPIVGTGVAGGLFFGSTASDTYERGLAAGLTPEAAKAAALKTGGIEALGELAGDFAGARTILGAGKVLSAMAKGVQMSQGKRVAVDLLANAGVQSGTEFGQAYGQTAVEREAGITTGDPFAAGVEGAKVGLGMSALMAPFGVAAGYANRPKGALPQAPAPEAEAPAPEAEAPATPEQPPAGPTGPLQIGYDAPGTLTLGYEPPFVPQRPTNAPGPTIPLGASPESESVQQRQQNQEAAAEAQAAYDKAMQDYLPNRTPGERRTDNELAAAEAQAAYDRAMQEYEARTGGPAVESAVSPSEGSPEAVVPSVTPQEPQTPAEPFSRPALNQKKRTELALKAQDLGVQVTGKMTKAQIIDAIEEKVTGKAPAAPAAPVAPAKPAPTKGPKAPKAAAKVAEPFDESTPESELAQAVEDAMASGAGMSMTSKALESAVQSLPGGKPKGRITIGRNIMAGIVRALRKPFNPETGSPATPLVYVEGTAKTEKDLTKKHAAQMVAMRDAALKVAKAYDTLSGLGGNVLPSEPKVPETAGSRAKVAGTKTASLQQAQQQLRNAIEELIAASGSAANANALVAAFKTRVQIEKAKGTLSGTKKQVSGEKGGKGKMQDVGAYWTSMDVNLSRAWKMFNDGQLEDTENLANLSTGEKRNAWEVQKKGAAEEPLVAAATEGAKRHEGGAKEKGILGVLSYLQSKGNTPYERMLASAVARALRGQTKLPKVVFDVAPGEHASYTPATDTIHLSKTASAEVVLHEALHAALQWLVYTQPNNPSVVRLRQAVKDVVAYDRTKLKSPNAKAAYDIIAGLAKSDKPGDLNAALLELVSYGMTMPDFVAALRQIPSTQDQKFATLGNKLYDMFAKLLQRFLGVSNTVANDVMDATARLLEASTEGDRAKAFGGKAVKGAKTLNRIDTATENFKRWFGDSKVVGENGEPLVVYHGTGADITQFKLSKEGALGAGIYMTPNAEFAGTYADTSNLSRADASIYETSGQNVLPLYVSIKNPLVLNSGRGDPMVAALVQLGVAQAKAESIVEKAYDEAGYVGKQVMTRAIAQGYDGIMQYRNGALQEIVAFSPNQIKSAIGNAGTFDPTKASILQAAVESSTPASNATQPGQPESLDLTQFTKKLIPNIITEHLFKAMGWSKLSGENGTEGSFQKTAGKVADYIKEKSPSLAKYISYINPTFGVPVPMREWFQTFKTDKHTSAFVTDMLANKISSYDAPTVLEIIRYLDGDVKEIRVGEKVSVEAKELADMLLEHRARYIAALRNPKAQQFFRDLKFSESMVFANSASQVSSNTLGARKLNELAAQKVLTAMSDNIYGPLDNMGKPAPGGRYKQLMETDPADTTKKPIPAGFIHESRWKSFPAGTFPANDGLVWTFEGKSADADTYKFTAYRDAAAAVNEGKADSVANAMRNTMAILAASYASNNLTDAIASKSGDADGVVFDNLAQLEEVLDISVLPDSVLQLSSREAKSPKLQGMYRNKYQWVQIPAKGDIKVEIDGKMVSVPVGTYGALQGKLIRADVWAAVQDMTDRRPIHDISALHDTMRLFKKAKTVYNPGTHITNIASNLTLAAMHDLPIMTVGKATAMLYRYQSNPDAMNAEERRVMHAFMNSGAMLGDFSSIEVKKSLYEAYKASAATNEPTGMYSRALAWAGIEKQKAEYVAAMAKKFGAKTTKFDEAITGMYAAEDNAFRLAAFLSKAGEIATSKGKTYLTPAEFKVAGDYARFAFLDYDIDSKAVKVLRQSVLPFVSWSYAIMPVLGHIALHKPWKLVNVMLAYALLDAAMGGDEDDEVRKGGPEKFQSRLWGVGPHAYIRLPGLGDDQNPVYFKLGAYIPTGNWFDKQPQGFLGINNWPQPITPGGPFTNAIIGLMGGVDPYTGKPLSAPTDSTWEEVGDRAKFMAQTFTPSWAPTAADVATKAMGGQGKPELGITGNPVGNLEAAQKFLGLQVHSFNTIEAGAVQAMAARGIKAEFDKELSKIKRAQNRYENPDWEAFYKRRDELLQRRDERIKELRGE